MRKMFSNNNGNNIYIYILAWDFLFIYLIFSLGKVFNIYYCFFAASSFSKDSTLASSASNLGRIAAIALSEYLPNTSTSKFTLSPIILEGIIIFFCVYSTNIKVKDDLSTSHTVKDVPSIAINPLGTMYFIISGVVSIL